MMRFENDNGDVFEGASAVAVVRQMSGTKLTEARSLKGYRRSVARRIKDMRGLTIDTSSDNLFLKSLVEHDLLRSID